MSSRFGKSFYHSISIETWQISSPDMTDLQSTFHSVQYKLEDIDNLLATTDTKIDNGKFARIK